MSIEVFKMFVIDNSCMLGIILFFLWLEYIWELYLSIRQFLLANRTENVPDDLKEVMSQETFEKAKLYHLDKTKFGFVKDTFSIILSSIVLYTGILAIFWDYSTKISPADNEVAVSCIWIFLLTSMSTVLDLPFSIYFTFVLEEKYGFNKQTARFFVIDRIKVFALSQFLSLPISSLAILIVKYGGDWFFMWLWAFVGLVMLILLTVYPTYIAPLFDKFTPLPEGELRSEIEMLATKLNFPLGQLYVVEGSKRSAHSNAYFSGLFGVKRIVLFDTLIDNYENNEVLAVLAHEIGHWKYGHIIKNIVIMETSLFLLFMVFAYTFKIPLLYEAVGFPSGVEPVLVGLLVVLQYIMVPYNAFLSFLLACLSRKFEFQADQFALRLNKSESLRLALIKLNKDNLGFPIYDELYSAWHHSHPSLLERLRALKDEKKRE
ncbi:CAAX prenyl protease 1 homolog [Agrilus planipennis]|uniref:CAAX prenyl protease n=1 Tax=Agrilus planipennis TaxID=224129 RepID=A0A1W4X7A5_AGRPL|nr:CAAX prenyl protease 1 homolog [Agrilus planipennis]